jgi:hypothetical protein
MSEITKEILQEALKGLATKQDLNAIKTDISGLKADVAGIRTGLALLATSEELGAVSSDVAEIKKTVNSHTTSLDSLVKKKTDKEEAKLIESSRLERMEQTIKQLAGKAGLKLDW